MKIRVGRQLFAFHDAAVLNAKSKKAFVKEMLDGNPHVEAPKAEFSRLLGEAYDILRPGEEKEGKEEE